MGLFFPALVRRHSSAMSKNFDRRRVFSSVCVASALFAAGCSKDEAKAVAPAALLAPQLDTPTLVSQVGAEPGPIERSEGPLAAIGASQGTIEVRRLGQESFAAIRNGVLYSGDQVRVGADARATIMFADSSTAEIAELSTLSIGSRSATADPASSAALLSGVARFNVAPRVAGEGPFVVFTPAGVVATKGTVFGVGVAATGDARVGVESGAVEVAGAAALDAPLTLTANSAVDLHGSGTIGAKGAWPADDWGVWRDQADAKVDVAAAATLHGNALAGLSGELSGGYDGLLALAQQVADFEAEASLAATADDTARYQKALAEGSAAIDASFLSALRLELLTHAYVSHALIASELYVRHPELAVYTNFGSRIDAAILWPKRYEGALAALLEPMRLAYYVHHPRGRAHAAFVGLTIPEFYAKVGVPELPSARAKLKFKAFVPPLPPATSDGHGLWIAAPTAGWHTQAELPSAAPRGKAKFWIKPAKLKGNVLMGAAVKAKAPVRFEVRAPAPRAQLTGQWKLALGGKVKLDPPDLGAARSARRALVAGVALPSPNVAADLTARVDAKAVRPDVKLKATADLKLDEEKARIKAAKKQKAELRANLKASSKAQLKAGSGGVAASTSLGVEPKELRAPKLGGSVKGSASLSLGM